MAEARRFSTRIGGRNSGTTSSPDGIRTQQRTRLVLKTPALPPFPYTLDTAGQQSAANEIDFCDPPVFFFWDSRVPNAGKPPSAPLWKGSDPGLSSGISGGRPARLTLETPSLSGKHSAPASNGWR